MKIITVTGYKGGVAKSTTAIHLASFFAGKGKSMLVDGDVNRSCEMWHERNNNLPFTVIDENQVSTTDLSTIDYLVVDTQARPSPEDIEELSEQSDLLVLPTTPDILSVQPLIDLTDDIDTDKYRVLLTIVQPKPSTEGIGIYNELTGNDIPVFKTMIRRSIGYQKCALDGKLINQGGYSFRKYWNDYRSLGHEILEVLNNEGK